MGKFSEGGGWIGGNWESKCLSYGKCKNFLKNHEFSMMPMSYLSTHKLIGGQGMFISQGSIREAEPLWEIEKHRFVIRIRPWVMVEVGEDGCAGLLPLHLVGVNPEVTVVWQAWQFGRGIGWGRTRHKDKLKSVRINCNPYLLPTISASTTWKLGTPHHRAARTPDQETQAQPYTNWVVLQNGDKLQQHPVPYKDL